MNIYRKNIAGVVAAVLGVGLPAAASAATVTRDCFPASADSDGDGYAKKDTKAVPKPTSTIHCPSGYVDKQNDCDDSNAAVHPRRHEVKPDNNKDDDCDGIVDEPEIRYPSNIYTITYTNGFWVPTTLTPWESLCINMGGTLTANVKYRDYTNTNENPERSTPVTTIRAQDIPASGEWSAWVSGIFSGHPHSAFIQFYCNGSPFHRSDNYYVYNDPADGSTPDKWARYWIVNQGFKEVIRSEHGEIGYRGTVTKDGTGFGADYGEMWCSEFYARTADAALNGIRDETTTQDIKAYFSDHGSWRAGLPTNMGAGNYLPMDHDLDGQKDHSTMALALGRWHDGVDHVWTIEGNCGNEVCIGEEPIDSHFPGEGLLTGRQNMFDPGLY